MLKAIKQYALRLSKRAGVFERVGNSRWRNTRLLILCYHGISLDDEHIWNGSLYMAPAVFERRLEMLKRGSYSVLKLGEAVERLYRGDLPPRSVVITFDDGAYDFYRQAAPRLEAYRFPATVYLTTYYCDFNRPVFGVACSYILWKSPRRRIDLKPLTGDDETIDLGSAAALEYVFAAIRRFAEKRKLSGMEKDCLLEALASQLAFDYAAFRARRILHLMTPPEVSELARRGVDFQLHTHRHRTPFDEQLFRREIVDNRARIEPLTGAPAAHFCYPSGVYRREFLPWLAGERVISATTCSPGLSSAQSSALLLPRVVDVSGLSEIEFESWLAGVSALLPRRAHA